MGSCEIHGPALLQLWAAIEMTRKGSRWTQEIGTSAEREPSIKVAKAISYRAQRGSRPIIVRTVIIRARLYVYKIKDNYYIPSSSSSGAGPCISHDPIHVHVYVCLTNWTIITFHFLPNPLYSSFPFHALKNPPTNFNGHTSYHAHSWLDTWYRVV